MSALYFHIPSIGKRMNPKFNERLNQELIFQAIFSELQLKAELLENSPIESIYIISSEFSPPFYEFLENLMAEINKIFELSPDTEVTAEVKPDSIGLSLMRYLITFGFNRVVLKIGSFHDRGIAYLNLDHTSADAKSAVIKAKEAGFSNCSVELTYGLPVQSRLQWKEDLEFLNSARVPHISASSNEFGLYEQAIKEDFEYERKPDGENPNLEDFNILRDFSVNFKYHHYDIVNLAKTGYESRQNQVYSLMKPYLGIGPGAESFNQAFRYANSDNLNDYIHQVQAENLAATKEKLTNTDLINEHLLLGLRSSNGVNIRQINSLITRKGYESLMKKIKVACEANRLIKDSDHYFFNRDYWLEVDEWLSWFFTLGIDK